MDYKKSVPCLAGGRAVRLTVTISGVASLGWAATLLALLTSDSAWTSVLQATQTWLLQQQWDFNVSIHTHKNFRDMNFILRPFKLPTIVACYLFI